MSEKVSVPTRTKLPIFKTGNSKNNFFDFPGAYYHRGYVMKEGVVNTDFRRRFLLFEADELAYYTKENLRDKKGVISLKKIQEVQRLKTSYKGRGNVLSLVLKNRTFLIQAENEIECNAWVEAINTMKLFWDNVPPSFYFDNAIEVDASFDLGEEPPSTDITSTQPPFQITNEYRMSLQVKPMAPSPSRFIGLKRSRFSTTTAPLEDSYDDDTDSDDIGNTDKSELDSSDVADVRKPGPRDCLLPRIDESASGDFSATQIDELFMDMKRHINYCNMCIMGNEIIDWLTIRKNWTREKCVRFGNLLLERGFLKPVSPDIYEMRDDGTIYRFAFSGRSRQCPLIQNGGSPVTINVSGQIFTTLEKTLLKMSGSFFETLLRYFPKLSQKKNHVLEKERVPWGNDNMHDYDCSLPPQNEDGSYFIDRNPVLFEDILDYLRDGEIFIPEDKTLLFQLKREAEFYKIQDIVDKCCSDLES